MRVGDLVKVFKCQVPCSCVFCISKSTRVGLVTESWIDENDKTSVIAEFDFGEQTFWSSYAANTTKNSVQDLEIISRV